MDAYSRHLYISRVISNAYVQICLYANGNVISVIKLSVIPLDYNSIFSHTQASALSSVTSAQKLSTVPMILEDMNEHTQVNCHFMILGNRLFDMFDCPFIYTLYTHIKPSLLTANRGGFLIIAFASVQLICGSCRIPFSSFLRISL